MAKLYSAEQTLRIIIDNLSTGIFWKDANSVFRGCNHRFASMCGIAADGIDGKTDFYIFKPACARRNIMLDRYVLQTRETVNTEYEAEFLSAGLRWVRVVKSLVLDEQGNPSAIVGIMEDVSERKLLEAALIREKEAAEEASRAKTDFLSRMSHEIRTPMNTIIGMTQIAGMRDDPQAIAHCLEKIDSASQHLMSVINDILDMAKIEAQRLELFPQPFNPEKMASDAVGVVALLSEQKRQTLLVRLDPALPQRIVADELRLRQVVTNLLSNAVKFTGVGGIVRLNISAAARAKRRARILIEVSDTGPGIPPEQLPGLFNPFEQGDGGITRRYGGTGLGLSICKRIADLMGGEILVDSQLGQGTTFRFLFVAGTTGGASSAGTHPSAGQMDLLVADPCPEVLDSLAETLSGFGFSCDTAQSGAQAVEMAENAHYDVILLDRKMVDKNGGGAARTIALGCPDSRIIITGSLCGWDSGEDAVHAGGTTRFLAKPLFPSALLEAVTGTQRKPSYTRPAEQRARRDLAGYRILLVEDVEINREIAAAMLEHTGIEITFAGTGKQATELVFACFDRYDLILMDIHMPEMDGYEAARLIRAAERGRMRQIPIIAMTADAFREDVERCLAAGMNAHIAKPIERMSLIGALEQYLPAAPKHGRPKAKATPMSLVNAREGLARVCGNRTLYHRLLSGCQLTARCKVLAAAIEKGEHTDARGLAHEIKGVALNLALPALAAAAHELEQLLHEKEDAAAQLPAFSAVAEQTEEAVARMLREGGWP